MKNISEELPPAEHPRIADRIQLLDVALRGTEIGLWDWDITTDHLTWINNGCEQWGLADFAGCGHESLWTSQVHEEDLPAYRSALERHIAGDTYVFEVEYRLRNKLGAWVWVQERGRGIECDAMGRGVRMVGLCLYIDERHRTAQALAQRIEIRARCLGYAGWLLGS